MADGGEFGTTAFTPDPENTKILRRAFGRFATGITVVTTQSNGEWVGTTANSFSSLSLDPALVLWSADKGSRRFPYFENADHFAIHILAADQSDICTNFAKSANSFETVDPTVNEHGVPLINNCLARFECKKMATYPGGDHMIMVGRVLRAEMRDGDALTFYAGAFNSLAQTS